MRAELETFVGERNKEVEAKSRAGRIIKICAKCHHRQFEGERENRRLLRIVRLRSEVGRGFLFQKLPI